MAETTLTATKPEAPRARRYKFRANAKAGRKDSGGGAFIGTCMVYEGDEFFLTLQPAHVKARGQDGKYLRDQHGNIKRIIVDRAMPTWADPIAEYPIERPAEPIRVIAGAAPMASGPVRQTLPGAAPTATT